MDKIVENIMNLVSSKGIEQKVFAEAIGIKSNVISDWKSGRTKSYTKYLDKIADYLEVSVDTLVNPFDANNSKNFDNLSEDDKEFLLTWIKNNIIPSYYYYEKVDSYGLKHEIPIYFNNGAFKGAMLKSGYMPFDSSKTNWIFKISSFSPALLQRFHYDNISFYQNVLQICKKQNLDKKTILRDIEDLGIDACIINAIMLLANHLGVSFDTLFGRTNKLTNISDYTLEFDKILKSLNTRDKHELMGVVYAWEKKMKERKNKIGQFFDELLKEKYSKLHLNELSRQLIIDRIYASIPVDTEITKKSLMIIFG